MAKTFLGMLPENNVLIVDALNLGFRWKHQNKTEFLEEYQRTVNSLANSYSCKNVIIACDKGNSRFRKALHPEYKQSRKEKYKNQTEEEKELFIKFFEEMQRTIDALKENHLVFQYEGVEADDIAGYLTKILPVEHIWLISSDRDWDLLVNHNVSRFSYVNRKETTIKNWKDTHDYSIKDYITIKCLNGDTGDNIPGIPGIGEKRAAELLRTYGSVFDIYDACPIDNKYKYIQNLNSYRDRLLLNVELMDILSYCDEAIGKENVQDIEQRCYNIFGGKEQ